VRLHQPFTNQSLAISQDREKAILIRVYPLGKPPVLLERRGVGNVSRTHERIEHTFSRATPTFVPSSFSCTMT
jgi:hypothetical protein